MELVVGVDAAAGHVLDHLSLLRLVSDREEDIQEELLGEETNPGLECDLQEQ